MSQRKNFLLRTAVIGLKETTQPDPGQAVKEIFFTPFLQTGQKLNMSIQDKDLLIEMPPYDPNGNWVNEAYIFKIEM